MIAALYVIGAISGIGLLILLASLVLSELLALGAEFFGGER